MNTYNIDAAALVYVLVTVVVLTLLVAYAFSYVMTDSGRLELKKLAVRRQFDLELAKVGAVEMVTLEETRRLMREAMDRSRGTEVANFQATINALISDRS